MPSVPNYNLSAEPFIKIPKSKDKLKLTPQNLEQVRAAQYKLKEKNLIAIEKRRLGQEEYERRLKLRIMGSL